MFLYLKNVFGGGVKLKTWFNKPIENEITGESWEVSAVPGDVSVVANGNFQGKTLQELIEMYPNELLGKRVYERFGKEFPILIKFIDAREDLSIQVHLMTLWLNSGIIPLEKLKCGM